MGSMERDFRDNRMEYFKDLEEVILGTVLIDAHAIHLVAQLLKPAVFGVADHRAVYLQMLQLYEKSHPIDLVTVAGACQSSGLLKQIGGPARLSAFTNRVASSANLEYHIRILMQEWLRKEIIKVCNEGRAKAIGGEEDALELLPNIMTHLLAMSDEIARSKTQSLERIASHLFRQIEEQQQGKELVPLFNLPRLDQSLDGAEAGDFIVIGARPSMGKSSLINNVLKASVDNHMPTYFMSLEMTATETMTRLLAACTEIDGRKIKRGALTEAEFALLHDQMERITQAPLMIDETSGASVLDFRAKVISYKRTHDIKVAILDRIGLLEFINPKGNTLEEIKRITKMLRRTAKELNICIIAISQLNRAVDNRIGSKEPQLSDLRDSGSLEQDAKKILLLYRPEIYQILQDENGDSLKGIGIISIAKNTNGVEGKFPFRFDAPTTQFKTFDEVFF